MLRTAACRFREWSRHRHQPQQGSSPALPPLPRGDPADEAGSNRLALVDDVSASIADAMRKHDTVRLSTLRMLKAALMNREIERGHALDAAESLQVVGSLVKQRRD